MTPEDPRLEWYAAALDEMAAFLLSDQIVWRLEHPPARLRRELSLGGLVLLQDELHSEASEWPAESRRRLEDLDHRWEAVRSSQPAALSARAAQELGMRLNLWKSYVAELAENPEAAGEYLQQSRQRTMIERLGDLSGASPAMEKLDRALRASFRSGPFLGEAPLEAVYPAPRFWFLYGRPSARP
jgi:hypothetical protein